MDNRHEAAVTALTYLVRSLLAVPEEKRAGLVGPGSKPWCELLEQVTRRMNRSLRPVVVPLLATLSHRADAFTPAQRAAVGAAARRVLTFVREQPARDRRMAHVAIEGVCRTFESAASESEAALRRIIDPANLAEYGFTDLPPLAGGLSRLVPIAPEFVEAVFRAAVAHREDDQSPTPMGNSALVPMTSTRRQDYGMALHQLAEGFPQFMESAPVEATGAVIAAVEAEVTKRSAAGEPRYGPDTAFRFGETEARFTADSSHIWDQGAHQRRDTHRRILDGFELGLVKLAEAPGPSCALAHVLDRVSRENRFAAVWRRLLSAATKAPHALAPRVWTLAAAVPVLVASDTVEWVGKFLQAAFD